ncbi:FAD:protein FMN transferase, partial [Candidatus Oleimmundimicrobium sp.]|uniref:FAD:protein FMN transferase n=1 Tax=Candidatus Oleimmundimicrobium sp. TaxID=3060597 RepID=UPI0027229790
MKPRKIFEIVVLIGIVTLVSWVWIAKEQVYVNNPYVEETTLMDTYVTIKAYGKSKNKVERAVNKAIAEIKRIDNIMNFYNENSEISNINKRAGESPVKISDDMVQTISLSLAYAEKTGGAFDPTIGALTGLWNFGKEKIPSELEMEKGLPLVDYHLVELDKKQETIAFLKEGTKLDFGGVAKGYAVDRAMDILKKEEITAALITTGSTTKVFGFKPKNNLWKIGIQHPRPSETEKNIMGVISTTDKSISTSGDYQQYFIKNKIRYHHILNPKTGMPAQGYISVTVITDLSAAEADILSTAIFVMGYPKGMDFIKQNN